MDELKDLVRIAFSKRIRKIEIINSQDVDKESQYFRYADGILKGNFLTDADAANAILGEGASTSAYKMLKKRLRDRLYNTILFIQPLDENSDSYLHRVFECYKLMMVAKILLTVTINKTGFKIMAKVMTKAKPLELFDIIQQCAIALRRQSLLEGDFVRFEEFSAVFKDANKKMVAEARAEQMNYDILVNFTNSLSSQTEIQAKLEKYKIKIEKLKDKYPTYQVNYYYYYILIVYHQLNRNYNDSVKYSIEFEEYIKNAGIFYTPIRHANSLIVQLDACLLAKNYTQGSECAKKATEFFPKGHPNWFKLQEMFFLLCLNTAKLDEAARVYIETTNHEIFKDISEQQQEVWRVYGGYLWFLLGYKGKQAEYPAVFGYKRTFRVASLLNSIPHFVKDKKGILVAVLILQILIFLQRDEFKQITERMDALRIYLYRYIDKEEAYRSHYFLRMLLVMEKYDFDAVKSKQIAAKFLWKLMEGNVKYTPTQSQMEIIPYEDLWNIIIEILSNAKKNSPNKAINRNSIA